MNRGLIVEKAFKGKSNIWANVIVQGSGPLSGTTATNGTFIIAGTGSTAQVWLMVNSSSVLTPVVVSFTGGSATYVRLDL